MKATRKPRNTPQKRTRKSNPKNITCDSQVHDKQTFIQYLKHLHHSKCKDDAWMKRHSSTSGSGLTESPERWQNHTIHQFLDAMLSGAGYDPRVASNDESFLVKRHPKNVWRFMAYLFSLGKVYE